MQQALDRRSRRRVVVHYKYDRLFRRHHALPLSAGSSNWKIAPCPELKAHKRPPCASMIVRLIDSPIPKPSFLVVKNAANNCSGSPAGSPGPESSTATTLLAPRISDR